MVTQEMLLDAGSVCLQRACSLSLLILPKDKILFMWIIMA